jgi:cysteine-rich repeat protein
MRFLLLFLVALMMSAEAQAQTGLTDGWGISCPQIQFSNGVFVLGDHATHHVPGDQHGFLGTVNGVVNLPDGTLLPHRNLVGVDDVYSVVASTVRFVQCYCANGDPDVPDGTGIQTDWEVVDSPPQVLAPGEYYDPYGCHWNIPFWDGNPFPDPLICKGATASHSNFYSCGCGDGVKAGNEQCDDGNILNNDGCSSTCKLEACGDGIKQTNEQCDDGNNVNTDACHNNCTLNICGDGVLNSGVEACDDGNNVNGDGCEANCTLPRCGNGILDQGEQCDDGNQVNGDGCSTNCTPDREICTDFVDNDGDGLVDCVDPDCECQVLRNDPARVTFNKGDANHVYLQASGNIDTTGLDPTSTGACAMLANEEGVLWKGCLLPGDVPAAASAYRYKDVTARTGPGKRDGIYEFRLERRAFGHVIWKVYAPIVVPDPKMTFQVVLGEKVWSYTSTWLKTSNGWKTSFAHR